MRGIRFGVAAAGAALLVSSLSGQTILEGSDGSTHVLTFGADTAILDAKDPRKDIPCKVTAQKPELGFDLKFHEIYDVSIPMAELNGGDDVLTMIFRVVPEGHPDDPVYFSQKVNVPKLSDNVGGDADLFGGFILGEGNYQVDWMMRDRAERVCSSYWPTSAALAPKDRGIQLAIQPGAIEAADMHPFREEPPVARDSRNSLSVKVLINFAPQRYLASSMQPPDMGALVSILRSISREPKIGKFSIVAFNMQEQRVVYRQDQGDQIDFPALGESLSKLRLGTVHVSQLGQKHSDTDFLTDLITSEMAHDHSDAVIFAGPKVMIDEAVPQDSIKTLSEDLSYPVFYMNYNLNPAENPWRDAIGNVVKRLRGYEFTISRPHDLWAAWSEIMSHIVKLRVARMASMPSATQ
jgi:hypothetical protein